MNEHHIYSFIRDAIKQQLFKIWAKRRKCDWCNSTWARKKKINKIQNNQVETRIIASEKKHCAESKLTYSIIPRYSTAIIVIINDNCTKCHFAHYTLFTLALFSSVQHDCERVWFLCRCQFRRKFFAASRLSNFANTISLHIFVRIWKSIIAK